MSMEGKVALISGGAEGIGAAVARKFVAAGGSVMLGDVQTDKAESLVHELGPAATSSYLDVRDLRQWDKIVTETRERFGKLTHLFNIAGISEPGGINDMPLDSWERTLAINVNGTMHGCRCAIPVMAESGEDCAIVNTGSMLALRPGAMFLAYCASKAAVTAMSKCMALECAAKGQKIRVNTVHPGAIDTPMYRRYLAAHPGGVDEAAAMFAANHPMGRVGIADEVANAMMFLASDKASFTTGVDLAVDGGGHFRS